MGKENIVSLAKGNKRKGIDVKKRLNYVEYRKGNSNVIILLHGGDLPWWNYKSGAVKNSV